MKTSPPAPLTRRTSPSPPRAVDLPRATVLTPRTATGTTPVLPRDPTRPASSPLPRHSALPCPDITRHTGRALLYTKPLRDAAAARSSNVTSSGCTARQASVSDAPPPERANDSASRSQGELAPV